MDKINQLTVNGQTYVLSDPETAKGLSQEISNRQAADETVLQTAQNYTDTATAELPTKEYVDSGLNIVHSNAMKAVNILGGRVTELETGYRHIATYTNDKGEGVMQIDITEDSEGNPFSCSEFHIHMTIPPTEGTQIYIGSVMYSWMLYSTMARSETYTKTLSIDLQHIGGGWWNGSMLADVIGNIPIFSTRAGSYLHSNFRSYKNIGEKASSLCFYGGNAPFPNGTVIEIYGK